MNPDPRTRPTFNLSIPHMLYRADLSLWGLNHPVLYKLINRLDNRDHTEEWVAWYRSDGTRIWGSRVLVYRLEKLVPL